MKITAGIEAVAHYSFSYDNTSKEFKDSLDSYKKSIYKRGDSSDVIKQCAHHFAIGGTCSSMVEGVGYVWREGEKNGSLPFSGIYIKDPNPEIELNDF
jgi:hypothetical protein